jgi:hypothetical protein
MMMNLQQRLLALETNTTLNNSAIDGGALSVYNAAGELVLEIGNIGGSGEYGIVTYDASGHPRVIVGQLPDGTYGLAVGSNVASGGNYVDINVPVVSAISGLLTTTSTSFTTLTGSPTLGVTVGGSGKLLVTITGTIGVNNATSTPSQGLAYVYVDGVVTTAGLAASLTVTSGTGGVQMTGATSSLLTGLSQGAHTLSIEYRSANGQTINFSTMELTAIPY